MQQSPTSPDQDLRVSLIQTSLHWHQPDQNRKMLEQKIQILAGTSDLVVLPEMFTSGFTLKPELSMTDNGDHSTISWMRNLAGETRCALTGSIAFALENGKFTNRMLFVTPEGSIQFYDKQHLFRMAGEQNRYIAGSDRVIVQLNGWNILLTVCYDLRFPVFCRNRNDYDLMLCVANWPSARRRPWRQLLQARAVENLAYVAGVNRVGKDGNGLDYSGDSMLVDFKGELLIDAPESEAFVKTRTLSAEELNSFRTRFPAWQDADSFELLNQQSRT